MTLKLSHSITQIRIVSTDKKNKVHRCQIIGKNGKAKPRIIDWIMFDALRKHNPNVPMGR